MIGTPSTAGTWIFKCAKCGYSFTSRHLTYMNCGECRKPMQRKKK